MFLKVTMFLEVASPVDLRGPMIFVDSALAVRLEETQAWRAVHYAQASQTQNRAPQSALLTIAGAPVIYGGPGLPVNRAIGLGMYSPVTSDDLDAIEAFYNARRASTVIDLCPLADPSLLKLLQTRGYFMRNWMSMLFTPLPIEPAPQNPDLRVTRAVPDQANQWLETSARGFDENDEISPSMLRMLMPNFYAVNAHCYFAWLGDVPIATGCMYSHKGVVELGGASTLLTHRHQGAQSALIQHRLADAHALGCEMAIVLTTPGSVSQRNMQRRGFQLAYTRMICERPFASLLRPN